MNVTELALANFHFDPGPGVGERSVTQNFGVPPNSPAGTRPLFVGLSGWHVHQAFFTEPYPGDLPNDFAILFNIGDPAQGQWGITCRITYRGCTGHASFSADVWAIIIWGTP